MFGFLFKFKKSNYIYENVEICNYYSVSTTFLEKTYVLYLIKTKIKSVEEEIIVERRFSDFEWLHNYLLKELKYQVLYFERKENF